MIKTKSGNVFPKDVTDWQLWDLKVSKELRDLYNNGYKVCIFTNQKGIQVYLFFLRFLQTKYLGKKN